MFNSEKYKGNYESNSVNDQRNLHLIEWDRADRRKFSHRLILSELFSNWDIPIPAAQDDVSLKIDSNR